MGQSFVSGLKSTPSSPVDEFNHAYGDEILLISVRFSGGGTTGSGHAETRLAILPAAYLDFGADGTAMATDALAISDHALDTIKPVYGKPLRLTFNGEKARQCPAAARFQPCS